MSDFSLEANTHVPINCIFFKFPSFSSWKRLKPLTNMIFYSQYQRKNLFFEINKFEMQPSAETKIFHLVKIVIICTSMYIFVEHKQFHELFSSKRRKYLWSVELFEFYFNTKEFICFMLTNKKNTIKFNKIIISMSSIIHWLSERRFKLYIIFYSNVIINNNYYSFTAYALDIHIYSN